MDRVDEDIRWTTELSARREMDGRVDFLCVVYVGRDGQRVAPIDRDPAAPKIVRELIHSFPCRVDRQLSMISRPLAPENTLAFVDFLRSPDRRLPIIFLSAQNRGDRPLADPEAIASWVGGLAHCYHATTRFTSRTLEDRHLLPHHLNAWDGAVRIYWPQFSYQDDPYHHRMWSPRSVEASRARMHFEILHPVSLAAAPVFERNAPSWPTLERSVRRREFEKKGADAGAWAKLCEQEAQSMEQENQQLTKTNVDLEAALSEAKSQLHDLERRCEGLQASLIEVQKTRAQPLDEQLAPEDLSEAVARAEALYPAELTLALNGASEVRGNPFERPLEALQALEFLAHVWRPMKLGTSAKSVDLDIELRERCGWKYRSSQSEQTMKKYRSEYTTTVDGKIFWLGPHIATRSAKDPKHSLRIAFNWDERCERVVVGYIGQHQRTDAS
ncbi:MAG: hypothetical protein K8J08_18600 [Thermoanaerobaculia bacterium]|nr:hypothetical protein [Thermoanaerobaculia bacterium]